MKVSKQYNVSASSYFTIIFKMLADDYKYNTKKSLENVKNIEGLEYVKTFGAKSNKQVSVKILEFDNPVKYVSQISSNRGRQVLSYQISEIKDGQIKVEYEEEFGETSFFNKWNYKILMPLMKKNLKRRMIDQLNYIANQAKVIKS